MYMFMFMYMYMYMYTYVYMYWRLGGLKCFRFRAVRASEAAWASVRRLVASSWGAVRNGCPTVVGVVVGFCSVSARFGLGFFAYKNNCFLRLLSQTLQKP